jgi:hypothetical protein
VGLAVAWQEAGFLLGVEKKGRDMTFTFGCAELDSFYCYESQIGGETNDILTAGFGLLSWLQGLGGNDTLQGLGILNFLNGGLGNDTVTYITKPLRDQFERAFRDN